MNKHSAKTSQNQSTEFIKLTGYSKDITSLVFGRLTVIGPVGKTKDRSIVWLCICKCGNFTEVRGISLRSKTIQSCGCLQRETAAALKTTHSLSHKKIYTQWQAMIRRCTDPKNIRYNNYGGRGISVCTDWKESFVSFYTYVSSLPHFEEDGRSLDRTNNEGNYEPGNVKWSTAVEQAGNTRKNVLITYLGRTQNLTAWARELGMSPATLNSRFRYGWSIEKALTESVRRRY